MVETWNYSFMVENMYVKSMTYYEDTPIQRHPLDYQLQKISQNSPENVCKASLFLVMA